MAACEEADPRVAWMNERVTVGLKMKSDRFVKMATSENDGPPVRDFLDNPDCQRIFFVDGAKECVSYALPPANTKKKVMYLLKPWGDGQGKALTKDTMDQLVCGDMSPKLMENMFSVFQDVYLPILSNPKNQEARHATPTRRLSRTAHPRSHATAAAHSRAAAALRLTARACSQGWPEVMSREVLELFHRMIARVYVGLGQSQGKTLLPLPPSDMLVRPLPSPPQYI